ncbi:hypothetical protein K2173_017155 [Erythroxylum novogranatense]|uniref:WRKY domain-containing protein n=1 Tax=Erythroxylum novogranatense TaxID=1862640 RepID=A0AAV8U964_9ROSI|nr:hypothetical protein K2173_017155 [Erythroxylum novogranatense]
MDGTHDPNFITHSSCPLGPDSEASVNYFLSGNRENRAPREFGWDLHAQQSTDLETMEEEDNDRRPDPLGLCRTGSGACDTSTSCQQSVSSSSSEGPPEKSTGSGGRIPKKPSKVKKKERLKRICQPRFAFMTKSEVDHLEDGYRWRKYGQKAVKNSPFPRGYYRCTNGKCTVKKRVERSSKDPTVVITTYEGQHCHHSIGFPRVGGIINHEVSPSNHLASQIPGEHNPGNVTQWQQARPVEAEPCTVSEAMPCRSPDEGLLGDVVHPGMRGR